MKKSEIDRLFTQWNHADTPGGVVAVIENGTVTHRYGYGLANLEENIAFTPSTKTLIASITKQFTTTCILRLAKQGKLKLTDSIFNYVPELDVPGAQITIRHLCQNASGLRDQLHLAILSGADYDRGFNESLTGKLIKNQHSLIFPAGDQYRYSNTNFVLLTWIIERLTEKPLADVFREWIFKPMGMLSSELIDISNEIPQDIAVGYKCDVQGEFISSLQKAPLSGDGGIYSTLDDMILWEKNFDHNIIGDRALLDGLMETRALNNGMPNPYALGMFVSGADGERYEAHAGGLDGYNAFRIRFPDRRLSVVTLSNRRDTSAVGLSLVVADLFLDQPLAGQIPARIDADRLQNYRGIFQNTRTGLGVELAIKTGRPVLKICGKNVILEAEDENRFHSGLDSAEWPMSLVLGQTPDTIFVSLGGSDLEKFQRAPAASGNVDEFVGEYRCEELESIYRLYEDDGVLILDIKGPGGCVEAIPLVRKARDSFLMDNQSEGFALLWFSRNSQEKIEKLIVSGARTQGLVFKRNSQKTTRQP